MAGILGILISENKRARLSLFLGIIEWLLTLVSLGLLFIGLYLKFTIEEYTNLVQNYDGNSLPYLLISIGLIGAAVNGIGGLACFMSINPDNRFKFHRILLVYIVISIIVSICMMASGMMCYAHIDHLEDSFQGGVILAMKRYNDTRHLKEEVDRLQMEFQCCGNGVYSDWFKIPWVNTDFLDLNNDDVKRKMTKKGYISQDVPFSCCNPKSPRPCIHQDVQSSHKYYKYSYNKRTTLYGVGCVEALMDYFSNILIICGSCVLLIFILQVTVIVLIRFLHSSIVNALETGNPTATVKGYLIVLPGAEKTEGTGPGGYGMETAQFIDYDGKPVIGGWPSDEFDNLDESLLPQQPATSSRRELTSSRQSIRHHGTSTHNHRSSQKKRTSKASQYSGDFTSDIPGTQEEFNEYLAYDRPFPPIPPAPPPPPLASSR